MITRLEASDPDGPLVEQIKRYAPALSMRLNGFGVDCLRSLRSRGFDAALYGYGLA